MSRQVHLFLKNVDLPSEAVLFSPSFVNNACVHIGGSTTHVVWVRINHKYIKYSKESMHLILERFIRLIRLGWLLVPSYGNKLFIQNLIIRY